MSTPLSTFDGPRLSSRLGQRPRARVVLDGYREAAVLVPVVVEPHAPARVLLTVRPAEMPTHAGQIAFPGGKREAHDIDAAACALREAAEELGLPKERVSVLGLLDDVPTPSRFVITPVVAAVAGPVTLVPSAREVAEVFACELEGLMRPDRYVLAGERSFMGVRYAMHEYHWNGHRIWGATARILHDLLGILG